MFLFVYGLEIDTDGVICPFASFVSLNVMGFLSKEGLDRLQAVSVPARNGTGRSSSRRPSEVNCRSRAAPGNFDGLQLALVDKFADGAPDVVDARTSIPGSRGSGPGAGPSDYKC